MEDASILFKKNTPAAKNPRHLKRNAFIIHSPRHIKIEPASFRRIDTEIIVFLPKNSNGFITSEFNGDKLTEVLDGEHRLETELLNR